MGIEEAIKHCRDVASQGCDECARDHEQLAKWLEELVELRKRGWHPASEKPIIPKDKEDIWVYCLVYGEDKDEKVLAPMFLRYTKLLTLGWVLPDDMIVVWWCYSPENN